MTIITSCLLRFSLLNDQNDFSKMYKLIEFFHYNWLIFKEQFSFRIHLNHRLLWPTVFEIEKVFWSWKKFTLISISTIWVNKKHSKHQKWSRKNRIDEWDSSNSTILWLISAGDYPEFFSGLVWCRYSF